MNYNKFSEKLIDWFELFKRDLPWRRTTDPYQIWLSEIILQQTRVSQGLPYFQRFVEQYPTVSHLAKAEEKDVLRLWQGLGYYSRGRNLHKSAKYIHEHLKAQFPSTYSELLKLKGVGKYTAGAVASFAFKEKVPVVDGNVMRVLTRVFGIFDDISTSRGQKDILEFAVKLLPQTESEKYNQAVMEFGAIVCTPKLPKCGECFFRANCYAFSNEAVDILPVKNNKPAKKIRNIAFFDIRMDDKVLMHERREKDIWRGLYQFYSREAHFQTFNDFFPDALLEKITLKSPLVLPPESVVKHVLTHQILLVQFWQILIEEQSLTEEMKKDGLRFFSQPEADNLPKSILIQKYLREKYF